ncbi:M48 family metallopeptidase [Ideonella sp. DXS29W]|uniref:M48 family metallopeptidase n=1 Tax=Ideonella lacteola TaxID=2984193 RepID=A0ABU9BJG9_9BURK
MQALTVSLSLVAALAASQAVKFWLAGRQARSVQAHRGAVPPPFDHHVSLSAHQRAADYTLSRLKFGLITDTVGAALLLAWTLLGGLDLLNTWVRDGLQPSYGDLAYQLGLMAAFSVIGGLIDVPLEWFRVFRLEQRFGFNRMTQRLFFTDLLKGTVLSVAIGLPLVAVVLWVMRAAGDLWWLWAWALWVGFALLMQVVFPIWIAPWFNRFEPLADGAMVERVQALMARCGFKAQGLFVMDGSTRSSHVNAYFGGMGKSKRVVLFDTLLKRLGGHEVEAVLAHELGHFHHKHVLYMLIRSFAGTLVAFAVLGWLARQPAFYAGLGVQPNMQAANDALALLLFMLAAPPFLYFLSPLSAGWSRRNEFEADAYARAQTSGADLASALLKLHEDNGSTLTPDPVYARFYYSHPPASERLAALAA